MGKLLSVCFALIGLAALGFGGLNLLAGHLAGGFLLVVGAIFVVCSVMIDLLYKPAPEPHLVLGPNGRLVRKAD